MQSEVEESLKRIQGHKGVIGIIVVNSEGMKINNSFLHLKQMRTAARMKAFFKGLVHLLHAHSLPRFFVVVVVGIPIRTTMDNSTTVQYAGLIHQLTSKARSTVRDIDPQVNEFKNFIVILIF